MIFKYNIYSLSESSAVIDLGNIIDEAANSKVLSMAAWLKHHGFEGIRDIVAAYSSLTILYDPFLIYNKYAPESPVFDFVKLKLEQAYHSSNGTDNIDSREISIPVCYHPDLGEDLKLLAAAKHMSTGDLINLHCSITYRVYMIGFLPGFAYMGQVDPKLAAARKAQPHQVEAGSVGIAGRQTGIYPFRSPGGWQIIGRTPLKLFDATSGSPALLRAGDSVRFYSISKAEFEQWQ